MKIVKLEQRSPEWLIWRRNGVGASESSAVLGKSKYKTPINIWEEKTERSFPQIVNADMQRGIDLEDEARRVFECKIGEKFTPMCAEHDTFHYLRASFDGVNADHTAFVEIKCPRTPKLSNALLSNDPDFVRSEFPENWIQVQHQYAVCTTATKGYLAAYLGGKLEYLFIPRDDEFIKETLILDITCFWCDYVVDDVEPPLSDADYVYVDGVEATRLAQEWKDTTEALKSLKAKEKGLRDELIDLGDDGNAIIGGVAKITRYGKAKCDYKKACEDNKIDMEQYKSEAIGYYRFTVLKDTKNV